MLVTTLKVIGKSMFFALLIVFICVYSSHTIVDCNLTYNINYDLKEFIQKTALIILSFLYPIITTTYLSLRLYSLQQQSILLNTIPKTESERQESKELYDTYNFVCIALLNIVKVLFWAFILYLILSFFNPVSNIIIFYLWALVELTIFIMFFYGLYQMIISTSEILQPT